MLKFNILQVFVTFTKKGVFSDAYVGFICNFEFGLKGNEIFLETISPPHH